MSLQVIPGGPQTESEAPKYTLTFIGRRHKLTVRGRDGVVKIRVPNAKFLPHLFHYPYHQHILRDEYLWYSAWAKWIRQGASAGRTKEFR